MMLSPSLHKFTVCFIIAERKCGDTLNLAQEVEDEQSRRVNNARLFCCWNLKSQSNLTIIIVSSKLPSVRWVNSSDSPSFFVFHTHRSRHVSCFKADSNWIATYSTFPFLCSSPLIFSFSSAGTLLASLGSTKICTSKPAQQLKSTLWISIGTARFHQLLGLMV